MLQLHLRSLPCHNFFRNCIGRGHAVVYGLHRSIVSLDDRRERLDLLFRKLDGRLHDDPLYHFRTRRGCQGTVISVAFVAVGEKVVHVDMHMLEVRFHPLLLRKVLPDRVKGFIMRPLLDEHADDRQSA